MKKKHKSFAIKPVAGMNSEINVTPLVDVVLVLLIIFMVMTPLMLKELGVNVPKKENVEVQQQVSQDQLVIEYRSGTILLNKQPIQESQLGDKMHDLLSQRANKVVFFNIDDDSPYGEAVHVMDIVRGAGAKTLGIMTKN